MMDWWYGIIGPSVWAAVAYTLIVTHATIVAVTVYLHRHSAHRAVDLGRAWRSSSASGCG